jgi:hypothetical protein
MIIAKLKGGLGNQMFQYACGRFLSERKNTLLKLDKSALEDKSYRPDVASRDYQLNVFNCIENFAATEEIQSFKKPTFILDKVFFKIRQQLKPSVIITDENYDLSLIDKAQNIYQEGYFQNEKYFKNIGNILLKEFSIKYPLNDAYVEFQNQIAVCNSVSIHIRRGDYVNNPTTNNYHGVCSLDYYYKAKAVITEKIADPRFFIFSDDIKWARENLKSERPLTFVSGGKNFEDLSLMSQCKHNIIANSSFSWWGGWLNENHEKIVVGPLKWFNDAKLNSEFQLPDKWIRV